VPNTRGSMAKKVRRERQAITLGKKGKSHHGRKGGCMGLGNSVKRSITKGAMGFEVRCLGGGKGKSKEILHREKRVLQVRLSARSTVGTNR